MFKKIITSAMASIFLISSLAFSASAVDSGEKRVTIGANLTDEQILSVYSDFAITRGSVPELTVTNAEERAYLEGLVSNEKIGSVSISCIYIETLDENSGISVTTNNINWCTVEMYTNALTTAGITDAKVIVSAPYAVSGTAALTGIYKAYEDITGVTLNEDAKEAAAEELVVTGELGDVIGSDEAAAIVNELKEILDQTSTMSDEELRAEIERIASVQGVTLSDSEMDQIISLVRSLEKLDTDALFERIQSINNAMQAAESAGEGVSSFFSSVSSFFSDVSSFISSLWN